MRVVLVAFSFNFLMLSNALNFEALAGNWVDLLTNTASDCVKSSKIEPAALERLAKYGEYKYDDPTMDYFQCFFLKLQVFDKNGQIDRFYLTKYTGVNDDDFNEKLYNTCKNPHGADLREKAYNLTQCIYFTTKYGIPGTKK